ncbi:unnamed protein product [Amoebophrya sp. A120]|nr:unnamed protein product [Amoebophrya sp. A120]|eukprot:GSA120T00015636001.1
MSKPGGKSGKNSRPTTTKSALQENHSMMTTKLLTDHLCKGVLKTWAAVAATSNDQRQDGSAAPPQASLNERKINPVSSSAFPRNTKKATAGGMNMKKQNHAAISTTSPLEHQHPLEQVDSTRSFWDRYAEDQMQKATKVLDDHGAPGSFSSTFETKNYPLPGRGEQQAFFSKDSYAARLQQLIQVTAVIGEKFEECLHLIREEKRRRGKFLENWNNAKVFSFLESLYHRVSDLAVVDGSDADELQAAVTELLENLQENSGATEYVVPIFLRFLQNKDTDLVEVRRNDRDQPSSSTTSYVKMARLPIESQRFARNLFGNHNLLAQLSSWLRATWRQEVNQMDKVAELFLRFFDERTREWPALQPRRPAQRHFDTFEASKSWLQNVNILELLLHASLKEEEEQSEGKLVDAVAGQLDYDATSFRAEAAAGRTSEMKMKITTSWVELAGGVAATQVVHEAYQRLKELAQSSLQHLPSTAPTPFGGMMTFLQALHWRKVSLGAALEEQKLSPNQKIFKPKGTKNKAPAEEVDEPETDHISKATSRPPQHSPQWMLEEKQALDGINFYPLQKLLRDLENLSTAAQEGGTEEVVVKTEQAPGRERETIPRPAGFALQPEVDLLQKSTSQESTSTASSKVATRPRGPVSFQGGPPPPEGSQAFSSDPREAAAAPGAAPALRTISRPLWSEVIHEESPHLNYKDDEEDLVLNDLERILDAPWMHATSAFEGSCSGSSSEDEEDEELDPGSATRTSSDLPRGKNTMKMIRRNCVPTIPTALKVLINWMEDVNLDLSFNLRSRFVRDAIEHYGEDPTC